MIIIGEKINGAIPSIKKAIAEHDEALIVERTLAQAKAGADFLDCAPSTATDIEYETMVWLIWLMQGVTQTPLCIDSPNAKLLARILEEGHVARPGMVNSVNEEGDKCETIFPLIAGTPWHVVGLTCDRDGIPADPEKKIDIAKRIIDKADKYGIALNQLHIDPCVMAIATMPTSMKDFERCIPSSCSWGWSLCWYPAFAPPGALRDCPLPCRKAILASAPGASGLSPPCFWVRFSPL